MTSQEYTNYCRSLKWKQLKFKILKRDCFQCVICKSKKDLRLHHLTYERVGNENLEDLQTLCKDCHDREKHSLIPFIEKIREGWNGQSRF